MADVNTYRYCTVAHAHASSVYPAGTIVPSANASVANNPTYWVTISDTDFTSGHKGVHSQ